MYAKKADKKWLTCFVQAVDGMITNKLIYMYLHVRYTCSWLLRSDMKCELVMPSNIITLPTQYLFGLFLIVSGIDLISEWLIAFLHKNSLYVLYIMLNTYL